MLHPLWQQSFPLESWALCFMVGFFFQSPAHSSALSFQVFVHGVIYCSLWPLKVLPVSICGINCRVVGCAGCSGGRTGTWQGKIEPSADLRGSSFCMQAFVWGKKAQLFGPGVEAVDAQIDTALSAAPPPPWEPLWHFSSNAESCWTPLNIALRALPTPPALLEAEPPAAKHPALSGAVLWLMALFFITPMEHHCQQPSSKLPLSVTTVCADSI